MKGYDDTIKIMVFGDDSDETRSLTLRYISGFFLDDLRLTIGVDFYSKVTNFNDKKIKLQLWTFGGEQRFRFLLHQYCKGARGGLFVFDIADSSSLAHIDDWLSVIRKEDRADIPIFLVGIIPDEKNKRRVSTQKGKKIATSKNLNGYFECNLKTGENVEKVLDELIRLILADPNYTPSKRKVKKYIKLKSKSLSSLKKIIGQGDSYSKSDFKSKKKKKNKISKNTLYDIPKFKIIIFGKDSVGKANFIRRSLSNLFSSESKMDIGVEIYGPKIASVDGQKVKLQAWDFSGKDRFRFFSPNFIRGAQGSLILFDVKDRSSVARIDDWLSIIRKEMRAEVKFPILVVGIVPDESEERQVTTEEGTKLAESRNLNGYIECSPKTGTRLMLAHKDCRPPQKRDEALPLNKDNLKENKILETEKQLLDAMGLRLEQDVNSLRNEKGVDSNVRLKFIGAKMSSPKAPFIPPLHPPLPSKSYRDQIFTLLSKIQRFWPLQNSKFIAVTLVQGRDTILYSTDNWDISADVGRVISSWSRLNSPFIVISGVKYYELICTPEILIANSLRGEDQILLAKEDDYTLILHVGPENGPMGNLDSGPPRDPGSASEAALVDF